MLNWGGGSQNAHFSMAKRGFSGLSAPCKGLPDYRCQATPAGGEGKFEGEGGFSGTLPPLQGQFAMQFAELSASQQKGAPRLASLAGASWLPTKSFLTPWKGLGQLLARWFSPQTGSGISLAWWRGLPDFLEGPTVANRGLSGLSAPSLPSHPCRGVGKFEGEGGFSGTLPPLQGQLFVMQLASTAAKVVKGTTSKLESQVHLRQKGPPDSHSEHMHLQFCRADPHSEHMHLQFCRTRGL